MTALASPRMITTPVLLVGGIGQRASGWREWTRELTAADVPNAIVSIPRMGFSGLPVFHDAIAAASAELRTATGAPAISIIGHSKGGVAAVEHLAFHPDTVDRVVAVASPLNGNGAASAAARLLGSRTPHWARDLADDHGFARASLLDEPLRARITSIARPDFDGIVTGPSAYLPGANHVWLTTPSLITEHGSQQTRNPAVRAAAWQALAGARDVIPR